MIVSHPTAIAEDWRGWRWPVFPYGNRLPTISHEFEEGARYKTDGSLNYSAHLGLDVMFPWQTGDPVDGASSALFKGLPRRGYFAPLDAMICAAGPGKIWSTQRTKLGLSIQIDHGVISDHTGGVVTFYQHLSSFARRWERGDEVRAGDALGTMGGDPANAPHLRHLHFEIWFPRKNVPQSEWIANPEPYLRHWRFTP